MALLAMAVRGAAVWRLADNLARDPDGYRAVARSLVDHGDLLRDGQPTAWRPPLYPLLLAKLLWISDWVGPDHAERAFVASVGVTQVICGVATALLVLHLGGRLGLGRWSLLAAVLVICDPLLVYQSAQVMTETLATLLAVCTWAIVTLVLESHEIQLPSPPVGEGMGVRGNRPHRAAALGATLGLAALCRPTFLPWCLLLLGWCAVRGLRVRQSLQPALAVAAFALALAPWVARNWRELGRPIVTTTHGGYTLLLANNTRFYDWVRDGAWGTVWDSREFVDDWLARKRAAGIDNEVDEDRLARQLAIDTMRDDPVGFTRATAVRLGRFWSVAPHASAHDAQLETASTRWLIAAWYLAEFALAVVGLIVAANSPRRASWLAGVLLVVALSVVHAVYWSDLRMRAPAMPVVALLAAAGASRLRGAKHPRR